jgi:hypothetical protein
MVVQELLTQVAVVAVQEIVVQHKQAVQAVQA